MKAGILDTQDHARDRAGLTYVYPVVSRRAGGVSIGVNLNTNNACNWRCIYCQVPDLKRGGPPPVDLARLEQELRHMLADVVRGDFMPRHVPEDMRRLNDIALSGNGEPTTSAEFAECVALVVRTLEDFGLLGRVKPIVISNGSQMAKPHVQAGLRTLASAHGEVWFKLDRATADGLRRINDTAVRPETHYRNLALSSKLCPTWLQTCLFTLDGEPPAEQELAAYLALLRRALDEDVAPRGVLLYDLARPSLQPEAPRLGALPLDWMQAFAERIRSLGLEARLHL